MAIDVKKYINPESKDTPIVVYQKDKGVIIPLDVVPSVENQVIETPEFVDGFAPVRVEKVTSGIDENIQAGNIRQGVNILGVEGNVVPLDADVLDVTPSVSSQRITPTSPKNAFSEVNVDAVTAEIDANIVSGNIRDGVSILGVNGSVVELKGEEREETLSSHQGNTYTPSSGKNGITSITVRPNNYTTNESYYEVSPSTTQSYVSIPNGYSGIGMLSVQPVTSSIDSNIQSENIKSGVSILGVNGSVIELNGDTLNAFPAVVDQTYTPLSPYNGYTSVKVNAVTSSIDSNIQAENIKEGVSILGVSGTYHPKVLNLDVNDWGGTLTNGVYSARTSIYNIDFTGVQIIDDYGMYYLFQGRTMTNKDVVFPDLIEVRSSGMRFAFRGVGVRTLSFPNLTTIGDYGLLGVAYDCQSLTTFSLPKVVTLSGVGALREACRSVAYLETIEMPLLETVSGGNAMNGAFEDCKYRLTSVSFPKLKTVSGAWDMEYCFYNDSLLETVSMPELKEISGYQGFYMCFASTKLATFRFEKLDVLTGNQALYQCFKSCSSLTDVYFPALKSTSFGSYTNQFYEMLRSNSNVTVHFPSNLQSVIGSWTDVTSGFAGTNTTVLFDLTEME